MSSRWRHAPPAMHCTLSCWTCCLPNRPALPACFAGFQGLVKGEIQVSAGYVQSSARITPRMLRSTPPPHPTPPILLPLPPRRYRPPLSSRRSSRQAAGAAALAGCLISPLLLRCSAAPTPLRPAGIWLLLDGRPGAPGNPAATAGPRQTSVRLDARFRCRRERYRARPVAVGQCRCGCGHPRERLTPLPLPLPLRLAA